MMPHRRTRSRGRQPRTLQLIQRLLPRQLQRLVFLILRRISIINGRFLVARDFDGRWSVSSRSVAVGVAVEVCGC